MLTFILAGAELELVPEAIAGHPAVRANLPPGKRAGEVLLDQNLHMQACRKLPDGERRGRPDIVHYTLLTLLESPVAKSGGVALAIHTRDRRLVRVRGDTRLPRGEPRFQGLLAKVLRDGASQDKDPLIWVEGERDAAGVLAEVGRGPVVRLDEGGTRMAPAEIATRAVAGDLTVVLGAFPSGGFPPEWMAAAPTAASIWPEPLAAWTVAGELVAAWRATHGP